MADTTDTPPDAPKPSAKPTPQRRRPARSATAKPPAKPGPTKAAPSAPPADTDDAAPAPKKRAAAPKPRSTNRATPAPKRRPPAPAPVAVEPPEPVAKPPRRWGKAALVGSVAALGAAALLSLRGSTRKVSGDGPTPPDVPTTGASAHTPDGQDASASFGAQIADENIIPDKI